jgi:hypothetical protein
MPFNTLYRRSNRRTPRQPSTGPDRDMKGCGEGGASPPIAALPLSDGYTQHGYTTDHIPLPPSTSGVTQMGFTVPSLNMGVWDEQGGTLSKSSRVSSEGYKMKKFGKSDAEIRQANNKSILTLKSKERQQYEIKRLGDFGAASKGRSIDPSEIDQNSYLELISSLAKKAHRSIN